MKKASEYRQHAHECRRLATLAPVEQLQKLLAMAAIWEAFADESAKAEGAKSGSEGPSNV